MRELNEKQWEFFRFVVLEVVHSKRAFDRVKEVLEAEEWKELAILYRKLLPDLLKDLDLLRRRYVDAAIRTAVSATEFKGLCVQAEAEAKASGKSDIEARDIVDKMVAEKRHETELACQRHLAASLGKLEKREEQLIRFSASSPNSPAGTAAAAVIADSYVSDSIIADDVLRGPRGAEISGTDATPLSD